CSPSRSHVVVLLFLLLLRPSPRFALFPYTTLFRSEGERLRVRMVREYCRYVQKYSLRQYSPMNQKVINEINLHLDSTLSLKTLADRKSTRLNSSHVSISYAVFCLKKKINNSYM